MMTTDLKRIEVPRLTRCESYYIGSCRIEDLHACLECKKATLPKA